MHIWTCHTFNTDLTQRCCWSLDKQVATIICRWALRYFCGPRQYQNRPYPQYKLDPEWTMLVPVRVGPRQGQGLHALQALHPQPRTLIRSCSGPHPGTVPLAVPQALLAVDCRRPSTECCGLGS